MAIWNDMDGITMERALKLDAPFEVTEPNNINNFGIYSAVCRNYISNNCTVCEGMSTLQLPSVVRRLLR